MLLLLLLLLLLRHHHVIEIVVRRHVIHRLGSHIISGGDSVMMPAPAAMVIRIKVTSRMRQDCLLPSWRGRS